MRIELETREYQFAHGKKPRGTGLWAFKILNTYPSATFKLDGLFWFNGTLSEAKLDLKKKIATAGPETAIVRIKVMP